MTRPQHTHLRLVKMGLLLPKNLRERLMAGCQPKCRASKRGSSKTKIMEVVYPKNPHVFVDVPAAARSNAVNGRSPMDVARSVVSKVCSMTPVLVELFFDKTNRKSYPPQREIVSASRMARSAPLTYEQITELTQKYNVIGGPENMDKCDVHHLPYLLDRKLDWNVMFGDSNTKKLAWRLIGAALEYAFLEAFARDEGPAFTARIYRPDGVTVRTLGAGPYYSADPAISPFGEADLQCFNAARLASIAGNSCVLLTVDTDFILMVACSQFTPTHPFILDLKSGAICGRLLAAKFGNTSYETRLNASLWMITSGSDYNHPFTRLGLYNRALLDKVYASMDQGKIELARRVITVDTVKKTWTFDHHKMLKQIGEMLVRTKTVSKSTPKAPQTSIGDALFTLMYYSFSFSSSGKPYPDQPVIDCKAPPMVFPLISFGQ